MAPTRPDAVPTKQAGDPPPDALPVDTSLIDEMLRLSPLERLRLNDRMVRTAKALQAAFAHTRESSEASP